MKITYDMIKGACAPQRKLFNEMFPTGVAFLDEADAVRQCTKVAHLFDWDWAADRLLTAPARAAYEEATAPARAAYEEATATAWAAYVEATAPARAAYEEATAPARAAYKEATAPARAAYKEATAPAFALAFVSQITIETTEAP